MHYQFRCHIPVSLMSDDQEAESVGRLQKAARRRDLISSRLHDLCLHLALHQAGQLTCILRWHVSKIDLAVRQRNHSLTLPQCNSLPNALLQPRRVEIFILDPLQLSDQVPLPEEEIRVERRFSGLWKK